MDDGVVAVEGKDEVQETSIMVQKDLARARFVTKIDKCNWPASRSCTWLGFVVDLEQGCIAVPNTKIDALKVQLRQAASVNFMRARQLASIIGMTISMALALGPVAR